MNDKHKTKAQLIAELEQLRKELSTRSKPVSAENELRQREEILRGLFENSSAVMKIFDPDDISFKYVNQAACNFYGYSQEEFLKLTIQDITTTPKEIIIEKTKQALKDKTFHFTFCHKLSSSELRNVEVYGNIININGKELVFEIVHDITERTRAEKELENYKKLLESLIEERTAKLKEVNTKLQHEVDRLNIAEQIIKDQLSFLETLINNIPVPIYIQNMESVFILCNKRFQEFLGLENSQIIGKKPRLILPENAADEFEKFNNETIELQSPRSYEMNFPDSNGNERQILNNKVAFRYSDGSTNWIVGIIIDITERKKLENEMMNALNQEKELHSLKSRFISTASHEFRTPLTSIKLYADLLAMYGRNLDAEKYMGHLNKIQKAVGNMTELINDVLTISKAETGVVKFSPVSFNLRKFCFDLIEEQKVNINERQIIKLRYKSKQEKVHMDEKILNSILSNLISNSIKYSPEGGEISFMVEIEGSDIIFTISDNGIGIPESDQKNLFEYFHRGENISNIPGTGLGLAIVKKSVELHNGTITFKSRLNEGTTFRVTLPAGH